MLHVKLNSDFQEYYPYFVCRTPYACLTMFGNANAYKTNLEITHMEKIRFPKEWNFSTVSYILVLYSSSLMKSVIHGI